MRNTMRRAAVAALAVCAAWSGAAMAEVETRIGLLLVAEEDPLPLSRLEDPAENDGVAGAEALIATMPSS